MHFKLWSAICFNLDQSEILLSGNGLTHVRTVQPDIQIGGKKIKELIIGDS